MSGGILRATHAILSALVIIFLVSMAEGVEWVFTARSPLGAEFFYDRETLVKLSNGMFRMTVKMTYPDEGRNQFVRHLISKDPRYKYYESLSYTLSSYEIDCAIKEFRVTSISNHSSDGQKLDSFTYDRQPPEGWLPIPPMSIAETIYYVSCPVQENK